MFNNAKGDEIEIENTTAHYISFGSENKNLIIIPGVGDGFKTVKGTAVPFSMMYKIFAKDYKVYVFSRRNELPENFSTEDMANDLINHMEKLGIEKADVVGVSQGGMIAEYLAINAPEKVNKLVLAVTCARKNDILEESVNTWIKMAENKDYNGIMLNTAEKSYVGKYLETSKKVYKMLIALGSKNATYERFIKEARSCLQHDSYDKLDKIKCPTLIIGAGQDKALGIEGSKELAEKIPNSEIYIYEEYSHGVYEQAKDFNERILEFLNK